MPNFLYNGSVVWGRALPENKVMLEVGIADYEDDGAAEDGSPIMRPIYNRIVVDAEEAPPA
jgi:hypothetical protein